MTSPKCTHHNCCRKGDPFQGPKVSSCRTFGNELSKETHVLRKQEVLLERGAWAESRRVREPRGTQEPRTELLCHVTCSLGFYGDGVTFSVVSAHHSDSQSFLVVRALLSQDGCQREGFWEVARCMGSPFDLSRTLPVGGGLLVLCFLAGPPVVKQLTQIVTMVPGQGGRLQSACFP